MGPRTAGLCRSRAYSGRSRARDGPGHPVARRGAAQPAAPRPTAPSPALTVREVIRELHAGGWKLDRQRGSHRQFVHPERPGLVTVAGQLGAELPAGTLASIRRQSGLPLR
jgi:predicted RNA binding protein YcfA (HicA-like mRNA interferase family)